MKWFDNTALTLVIIGALNWLLVGIFKLDIVAVIFGNLTWISRIIYTIIGLCGLYLISLYEESEVHPKKGVSVLWMPLLYFYILFFRNCFHNCCHIFIKQWLCISIHYNRDIWMIVLIFCKKNETIPGQLGCSCFSADDSYIIWFFCFTGSIKLVGSQVILLTAPLLPVPLR